MKFESFENIVRKFIQNACEDYNLKIHECDVRFTGEDCQGWMYLKVKVNHEITKLDVLRDDIIDDNQAMLDMANYEVRRWIKNIREQQLILELADIK